MRSLEEAIELPFAEYMAWCHDWCRARATNDPIFQDVYINAAFAMLETGWARRYWFHHCDKLAGLKYMSENETN
jgi:hypothetical protein